MPPIVFLAGSDPHDLDGSADHLDERCSPRGLRAIAINPFSFCQNDVVAPKIGIRHR
jgi:hypothetical protein